MSEEHGTLIKTPKQLIVVSVLALVTPVAIALLGSQLVTGSKRIDTTEDKKSVEQRIKPVGELVKLDGAAPAPAPAAGVVAVAAKAKSGDEVYNEDTADKGVAEIIIAKQRNGPIGTVRLTFLGEYTRFENFAAPGSY